MNAQETARSICSDCANGVVWSKWNINAGLLQLLHLRQRNANGAPINAPFAPPGLRSKPVANGAIGGADGLDHASEPRVNKQKLSVIFYVQEMDMADQKLTITPAGEPAVGKTRVRTADGRVFDLVRREPYQRKDGAASAILTWESLCQHCAAPFEVSTGASGFERSKNFELHHCPEHRLSQAEITARRVAARKARKSGGAR